MLKKNLVIAFIVAASASIYCINATDSNVHESNYAQFAALYESLFNEAPTAVWTKSNPSCGSNPCSTCTG